MADSPGFKKCVKVLNKLFAPGGQANRLLLRCVKHINENASNTEILKEIFAAYLEPPVIVVGAGNKCKILKQLVNQRLPRNVLTERERLMALKREGINGWKIFEKSFVECEARRNRVPNDEMKRALFSNLPTIVRGMQISNKAGEVFLLIPQGCGITSKLPWSQKLR